MRAPLHLAMILLPAIALVTSPALAGRPGQPVHVDPDLKLGSSCSGHLAAKTRAAMLPTEIRETIVLWPRAGKRTVGGVCQSVTRFTLVNHTGQVVTISFIEIAEDDNEFS